MNRRIALVVCFGFGLLMFAQYFSAHPTARTVNQAILEYWQIIFAFALILGVVSFVTVNLKRIGARHDVPYRWVSLLGLVAMPVMALLWGTDINSPFMWTFENVQAPMQATVFALLAFFVASASYRGFRARSLPAALLLTAALITLLSCSQVGGFLDRWLMPAAEWIRDNPSMSARRAILIGIGLGSLTTSLRVIVGIERTWLGGQT